MISEVNVTPIKPAGGLVAFASVVIDSKLYLSSIAVYQRLDGGYRVTYPTRKVGDRQLNVYHPVNKELGLQIEHAITAKCNGLFKESNERHDRYSQVATPQGSIPADKAW